jgi:hypothetical protein
MIVMTAGSIIKLQSQLRLALARILNYDHKLRSLLKHNLESQGGSEHYAYFSFGRYDTQRNDTQHNDTQHNDTQHNNTQHNI